MKAPEYVKVISAVEIIGGFAGIVLSFVIYFQTKLIIIPIMSVVPCTYSIFSGYLLWNNTRTGVNMSIILQALQVFKFSAGPFMYNFFSGIQLGVYVEQPKIGFLAYLGGLFEIGVWSEGDPFMIGLNIIALIFLNKLLKHKKSLIE